MSIYLSIDGGASHTRGVIFSETGDISGYSETSGSSLSVRGIDSPKIIGDFLIQLSHEAKVDLDEVQSINLGLAGVSNLDGRERLFKELDRLRLSDRVMLASDVEAAYEVCWADKPGILLCVGTGAIVWGKDETGQNYRASGLGPDMGGDPGSGYWMGKKSLVQLLMNENADDRDIEVLRTSIIDLYGAGSLEEAAAIAGEGDDHVFQVSRMGLKICELAANGNEVALAIVQEGTQGLAESLLEVLDQIGMHGTAINLAIVGSVIEKSQYFRQAIENALIYDIEKISWHTPHMPPVFGAGLIACRLNNFPLDISELKASWSKYNLRTTS
ncbi:BadF/BadG/BcrA/BcrD ATPase family protein [Candidatus Neomarinimicrobiota bacterium]